MENVIIKEQNRITAKSTAWEDLRIDNDFLFGKIMQDPALCREMLRRILPELNIERIEYPERQKIITPDMDAHGVRLDIYVKDNAGSVYDVEIQMADTKELPKRSRYYGSMIDLQLLDKGQHYRELNRSYVIFICPFDIFGKGRHIYTFEYICRQDTSIFLQDHTTRIFLNARGTMKDISPELKAFLDYIVGKNPADSYINQLEEAVQKAKLNRTWRHEYMTLLMRDQENLEKGIAQGIEQGIKQGIVQGIAQGKMQLVLEMLNAGELSLEKAAQYLELPIEEMKRLAAENK